MARMESEILVWISLLTESKLMCVPWPGGRETASQNQTKSRGEESMSQNQTKPGGREAVSQKNQTNNSHSMTLKGPCLEQIGFQAYQDTDYKWKCKWWQTRGASTHRTSELIFESFASPSNLFQMEERMPRIFLPDPLNLGRVVGKYLCEKQTWIQNSWWVKLWSPAPSLNNGMELWVCSSWRARGNPNRNFLELIPQLPTSSIGI